MIVKASRKTSCKAIFSSLCVQRKKWMHIGSKGELQMQCDTPRTKKWERLNLVHNMMEKTFESKQKKEMIR